MSKAVGYPPDSYEYRSRRSRRRGPPWRVIFGIFLILALFLLLMNWFDRDEPIEIVTGPPPSMAPIEFGLNPKAFDQASLLEGDRSKEFLIFHDSGNKPQGRASVPFSAGYVELPISGDGVNSGPLNSPAQISEILHRLEQPQLKGDIKLYADKNGQPQIMHFGDRYDSARWEWDVTLPEAEPGLVPAIWIYGGPKFLDDEGYQFEIDIEFLGSGKKGTRMELNFHDGKGPPINFGTIYGDWSGQRLHLVIERDEANRKCVVFSNGEVIGEIDAEFVEKQGRTWLARPMYGIVDMIIVRNKPDNRGKGLMNWAGKPNLEDFGLKTMTVHGYRVTPLDDRQASLASIGSQ